MTGRIVSFLCVGTSLWALILAGCNAGQAYDKRFYVLRAARPSGSTATETDCILEIRRLTIDSAFGGKGLIYRTGQFEYESDFYNEFLVSPSGMMTEKMRNWLTASGLFRRVLNAGSQVDPTHILEGNVTGLYGDFTDRSAPQATIEIRIFLLKSQANLEPTPVFGKTYKSSAVLESAGPDGLVEAMDRCLEEILSRLEADLAKELAGFTAG
jgi:uncharacterized lipoprotein YmbA